MFVHAAASPEPAADDEAQALSKAEEILAKERAKPRDIAWAWTVLMDHRQGVAPEHNERRFRQILERHRWILALPVLTTDESGCPTRPHSGTPVSGIDCNADPEDRLFMRMVDVRGEAVRQGLSWPDEPSAPAGGVVIESCQPAPVEAGLPRQQANHGLSSDAEITVPLDCELFELAETGVGHWLAMDGWSLEESAILLCGANPQRIEEFAKDPNVSRPDYTSCGYMGIADRLRRAAETGVLSFPSSPSEVIRWAAGKHAIPDVFRAGAGSSNALTSAGADGVALGAKSTNHGCEARPSSQSDQGAAKDEISTCFPPPLKGQSQAQWEKMLGDPPKWMTSARIDAGGKGIQSRWNPAQLAMCIHSKKLVQRGVLRTILRKHFPEYLEQWEVYIASLD